MHFNMTVELSPEMERLVLNELERGQYNSVEEVIAHAVQILHDVSVAEVQPTAKQPLGQFLLESPLRDSELRIGRERDYLRSTRL